MSTEISTVAANSSITNPNNNNNSGPLMQVAAIANKMATAAAAMPAQMRNNKKKNVSGGMSGVTGGGMRHQTIPKNNNNPQQKNNNNQQNNNQQPTANDDNAAAGGEEGDAAAPKMVFGVNVNLTAKQQREQYKKTVRVFEKTSVDTRACKYMRQNGTLMCTYIEVGPGRFVRHGVQQWCDAAGQLLRQRHWRYGKLHGMEQMWLECYVIDCSIIGAEHVAVDDPSAAIAISVKMLVESRCWDDGKMVGIECVKEAHRVPLPPAIKTTTPPPMCWVIGPTQHTQEWQNGLKNGRESRTRTKDGREILSRHWKQGCVDGVEAAYYRNGALHTSGTHCNGRRVGAWRTYDRHGNMLRSTQYKNGVRHGQSVAMVMQKEIYVNGKRQSPNKKADSNKAASTATASPASSSGASLRASSVREIFG